MDRDLLMVAANQADELILELKEQFPDVRAGITGQIARERDEQVYSEQSIGFTSIIAIVAILVFLMVSFRMWVAPLMATANLVVGLIWAMGAAYIAVGQLNMMTAMLSVLFLGLGIDFSIHIISGFSERRSLGDGILESLLHTFQKSGKGILTGGLTTACAFLTLVISQARGMREMGIVAGTGLLAILLATFLVLPIMLVFRERRLDRRLEKKPAAAARVRRDISFRFMGRTGMWMSRHYIFTITVSLLVSALLIWSALGITWDLDFRNMEPKGLTSIELMDTIMEKFDLSMEYALVLTDSLEESRELAENFRDLGTVAITEDITQLLPTPEQQKRRVPHIDEIRRAITSTPLKTTVTGEGLGLLRREIGRLQDNIMEMQDMAFVAGRDKVDDKCKTIIGDMENPDFTNRIQDLLASLSPEALGGLGAFQAAFSPYLKDSIVRMCSTETIRLEDIPNSLLDRYSNKTRDIFMVTVYPSGSLYDGEYTYRFAEDLERVSPRTTGWAPLMVSLLDIFGRDGRNAILLTLGIVFILLWIDFKKIRFALMAMVPLAFGMFWMVGLMNLTGILLSMTTVMGLPLIVGIGIDDGVHIMHRWRSEGENRIFTVFSSTGKAILLTSVTTMLAFGSLVFSAFPAWGQFGGALFLGVGACFLTTAMILPGIIGLIERKNHRSEKR
jgi:predicted RND superfamily exporter protein